MPDDSEKGYILEVDLKYPRGLHDMHKNLPLATEYTVYLGSKESNCVTTLFVLHYGYLKLYWLLG